jgi:hypothetical protein
MSGETDGLSRHVRYSVRESKRQEGRAELVGSVEQMCDDFGHGACHGGGNKDKETRMVNLGSTITT